MSMNIVWLRVNQNEPCDFSDEAPQLIKSQAFGSTKLSSEQFLAVAIYWFWVCEVSTANEKSLLWKHCFSGCLPELN